MLLRSDILDIYIFRTAASGSPESTEFLQLLRADSTSTLPATWQPVMGHIESGETAVACALRELNEETGLAPTDPSLLSLFALQSIHPYFLAATDSIILSPRFAAHVSHTWQPRLNHEHTSHRWVPFNRIDELFMWPGQRNCCREIVTELVNPRSFSRDMLRIQATARPQAFQSPPSSSTNPRHPT